MTPKHSSKITLADLEAYYCVGVTEQERAKPQRLLLTVELNLDFARAAASDQLEETINYQSVADDLLHFGEGRSWRLIEKLATDIAAFVLGRYTADSVTVEVKKFVIPQARYVAVSATFGPDQQL